MPLRNHRPSSGDGQILPLFALFLVALLGFAALAIDVSSALSSRRLYRAVADAASLAGAQDLQVAGSAPSANDRQRARAHALQLTASQLGATATPTCATTSDIVDCALPGTPYLVSIKTPAPTCVSCNPSHAVQVSVNNPQFQLSFTRLFNLNTWNVGSTSVAGLAFGGSYALVTLRPPNPLPNGLDQNRENIDVNGTNTRLNILSGDVGTNTSAYTNSGGFITLAPGYFIDHIDDIPLDPWNKDPAGNPRGRLISSLIEDPDYRYPSRTGLVEYDNQKDGEDVRCALAPTGSDAPPAGSICYIPGIYRDNFNVKNGDTVFLESGVYFFDKGADIRGTLLGGTVAGAPGVVIVLTQDRDFSENNSVIRLNRGPATCVQDSCRARPAVDAIGPVKTPEGLPLSLMVTRDPSCFSGTTPVLCSDNLNTTLSLPGNGDLAVTGVIYGPSDQMVIAGDGTAQVGDVGQIISWTIKYTGGAQLNQSYPRSLDDGVLRLDAACTAPGEPCNP